MTSLRNITSEALWQITPMRGTSVRCLAYDTFVHPGIFPNPVTWIAAFLFEGRDLYAVESMTGVLLLVLAGLAALAFLRTIGLGWFESTVGAACYELSPLTILKLSQQTAAGFAEFAVPNTGAQRSPRTSPYFLLRLGTGVRGDAVLRSVGVSLTKVYGLIPDLTRVKS
jgi:hypothetical protein